MKNIQSLYKKTQYYALFVMIETNGSTIIDLTSRMNCHSFLLQYKL